MGLIMILWLKIDGNGSAGPSLMVLCCLIKAAMKAGQVVEVFLMSRGSNDGGIVNVQTELSGG